MKIQGVKGTRDFYPEQMRLRNYIVDAWRRVSLRNGFEEYDSPIFEYLDLFTAKSGDEIAEQLFNFTDRGDRNLAIRPEITPALARMVNAKINALPRPIKWFSVPRLCRAENPQRGRLREFFQWNIDIIGVDDVLADAECIYVCVDLLRELNLSPDQMKVRIGSRALTTAAIEATGVPRDKVESILPVLDKRPKVTEEAFGEMAENAGVTREQIDTICRFQDSADIPAVRETLAGREGVEEQIADLEELWGYLEQMGIAEYCVLDLRIVRGLAYYTGIVYEVFDEAESRAVAGGGRYDNLLQILGGPKVGATGFGMGDVVLGLTLEDRGKLPEDVREQSIEFFVIDGSAEQFPAVMQTVGQLRRLGFSAEYNFKRQNVGKQLKAANKRGARRAIIIRDDGVGMKDLTNGEQVDYPDVEALLAGAGRRSDNPTSD